jgi:carbonic anhydrase
LISYIEPALKAGKEANGDCIVSDTVKAHVNLMVKEIESTVPILSHEVKNEKLRVVPAYYRLATGKVEFLFP